MLGLIGDFFKDLDAKYIKRMKEYDPYYVPRKGGLPVQINKHAALSLGKTVDESKSIFKQLVKDSTEGKWSEMFPDIKDGKKLEKAIDEYSDVLWETNVNKRGVDASELTTLERVHTVDNILFTDFKAERSFYDAVSGRDDFFIDTLNYYQTNLRRASSESISGFYMIVYFRVYIVCQQSVFKGFKHKIRIFTSDGLG